MKRKIQPDFERDTEDLRKIVLKSSILSPLTQKHINDINDYGHKTQADLWHSQLLSLIHDNLLNRGLTSPQHYHAIFVKCYDLLLSQWKEEKNIFLYTAKEDFVKCIKLNFKLDVTKSFDKQVIELKKEEKTHAEIGDESKPTSKEYAAFFKKQIEQLTLTDSAWLNASGISFVSPKQKKIIGKIKSNIEAYLEKLKVNAEKQSPGSPKARYLTELHTELTKVKNYYCVDLLSKEPHPLEQLKQEKRQENPLADWYSKTEQYQDESGEIIRMPKNHKTLTLSMPQLHEFAAPPKTEHFQAVHIDKYTQWKKDLCQTIKYVTTDIKSRYTHTYTSVTSDDNEQQIFHSHYRIAPDLDINQHRDWYSQVANELYCSLANIINKASTLLGYSSIWNDTIKTKTQKLTDDLLQAENVVNGTALER